MRKACLLFAKQGRAVWISHLDLMRVFARAFARARVPLAYSEGFNPHPYLSFALPLPVGVDSGREVLYFGVEGAASMEGVPERLTPFLPEGFSVLCLLDTLPDCGEIAAVEYQYQLRWISQAECNAALALFDGRPLPIEKKSKKGVQTVNIAPLIQKISLTRTDTVSAQADILLSGGQSPASPSTVLKAFQTHATAPESYRVSRLRVLSIRGGDWTTPRDGHATCPSSAQDA